MRGSMLPHCVIIAAVAGDNEAMYMVLEHFRGYIARLSMRTLYDDEGRAVTVFDTEIRDRLESKLLLAIPAFQNK